MPRRLPPWRKLLISGCYEYSTLGVGKVFVHTPDDVARVSYVFLF